MPVSISFLSNLSSQSSFLFIMLALIVVTPWKLLNTADSQISHTLHYISMAYVLTIQVIWTSVYLLMSDEFRGVPIEYRIQFAEFCLKRLVPSAFWLFHLLFVSSMIFGHLSNMFVAMMQTLANHIVAVLSALGAVHQLVGRYDIGVLSMIFCIAYPMLLALINFPIIGRYQLNSALAKLADGTCSDVLTTLIRLHKSASIAIILTSISFCLLSTDKIHEIATNWRRSYVKTFAMYSLHFPAHLFWMTIVSSFCYDITEICLPMIMTHCLHVCGLLMLMVVVRSRLEIMEENPIGNWVAIPVEHMNDALDFIE